MNTTDARANECVEAFKPLADAATAAMRKHEPLQSTFWVVAKQNPGASPKMFLPMHATSPTHLECMQRPPMPGSGFGFAIYVDESGAVREASRFSYQLNRCVGLEYYIPVKVFPDGNQWAAVHRDFINLQESPAGLGDSIEQAVADLDAPSPHKGTP